MTPSQDDTTLLLEAGRGDRRAFGALVEMHQQAVIGFIHRFLGIADRATAEDIAQEVFLAAWKAAPRFEPRASVRTWLLRITTNTCLNHARRNRRRPATALTAEIESDLTTGHDDPGAAIHRDERSERMQSAIASLSPKQRAAILLRHAHGLSCAEIARVMETNVGVVKSLLFRGHERLRGLMAGEVS
jgi:RNA polymerase sigma-70 factor (ECF subfamily)